MDKKLESSDLQTDDVNISVQKPGDESIELEETSYKQWLAAEGLVKLQDQGQDIRKINDVNKRNEDASKQDDSKQDDSKKDDSVINDGDRKQDEKTIMISKMDKMKRDVEEMLSKSEGQADSEERIRRLQNILQLLDNNNELNTEKKNLRIKKWRKTLHVKQSRKMNSKKKTLNIKRRGQIYQREGLNKMKK